ncbi:MAG: hypothetical protein F4X44_00630 [Gammaproteobacteria bacterium]|nr:hypothetical protein [Gammaproteobacteria bacterium]MYD79108.1 hypothetical protein [Gammaproteobacteria bacterium]
MQSHSEVRSIVYLLERLGDFSGRTFLEQGETNDKKETWIRKRVVALRALIDNYPAKPWMVECLSEYEQSRNFTSDGGY